MDAVHHHLDVTGTLSIAGSTTNVEMGLQRAGDVNGDNVVSLGDFNLLKNTFGCGAGVGRMPASGQSWQRRIHVGL